MNILLLYGKNVYDCEVEFVLVHLPVFDGEKDAARPALMSAFMSATNWRYSSGSSMPADTPSTYIIRTTSKYIGNDAIKHQQRVPVDLPLCSPGRIIADEFLLYQIFNKM